jgi:hypothetical protein
MTTIYNLPNDIISEILYHHVDFDDIKTCLLTAKLFHVLTKHQSNTRKLIAKKNFYWCLLDGDLDACKWMYEHKDINIEYPNSYFSDICYGGRLNTLEWFYQLFLDQHTPIDIHYDNDFAFNKTCRKGHLHIAKWLYEISKQEVTSINIHRSDEDPFCWACSEGHFELAVWLLQISNDMNSAIDIHILNEEPFRFCCANGHLQMAQWLYNLAIEIKSPINFETTKCRSFYWAHE